MRDNKKKIAAIAAVVNYIKSEQEAMAFAQAQPAVQEAREPEPLVLNLWGISGRQQQMQMRSLMQLKAFHGTRHRY